MQKLAVAPIVEGHSEMEAVPILLRRIFAEMFGRTGVEVLKPIRIPRSKLIKPAELMRAVRLADLKLKDSGADKQMALVLFDADQALACQLAPTLLEEIKRQRPDVDATVVLAVDEYETWFVAAAESLTSYLEVVLDDVPRDPEAARAKKAWVQQHARNGYSETADQPALTARMNLELCRSRSKSFDKLCRELEKRA